MIQWLVIATVIIIMLLISDPLKKYVSSKIKPFTRLIMSFAWFIGVAIFFSLNTVRNNFTLAQQIVLYASTFCGLIYFYFKYKKLKKPPNVN